MDRDEPKRTRRPTFSVTSSSEAAPPRALVQLELTLQEAFSHCQKQALHWVGEAQKDLEQLTKLQEEVDALAHIAHLLISWSAVCQKEVQRALDAQPSLPPLTPVTQGPALPFLKNRSSSSSAHYDDHPSAKSVSPHPLRSRVQEVMIPLLIEIVGLKCRVSESQLPKLTSLKQGLEQLSQWAKRFEEELKELHLQLTHLAPLSKGKIIERMKQLLSLTTEGS